MFRSDVQLVLMPLSGSVDEFERVVGTVDVDLSDECFALRIFFFAATLKGIRSSSNHRSPYLLVRAL